jgi:ribosomal protein S2
VYELADRLSDYFTSEADAEIRKKNDQKVQKLKEKLEKQLTYIKSLKNQLKVLIEQKCVHEASSNIIS